MAIIRNWRNRGTNWFDLVNQQSEEDEGPDVWARMQQSQGPSIPWAEIAKAGSIFAGGIPGLFAADQIFPEPKKSFSGPSIAEVIRRNREVNQPGGQIGSALMGELNRPPGIGDILGELAGLGDFSKYLTDPTQIQEQARASVDAQYGPLIAALQAQKGAAETRAATGKREVGDLYSALSNSLNADIPQIDQMYDQADTEQDANYAQLEQQINKQYDQSAQDQADLFKQLNIQAAAEDTMPQQFTDRAFFQGLGDKEQATADTALGMESRGAQTFTRQGAQLARQEGTNRQADIMRDLAEMLGALDSQITSQTAAKNSAYTSAVGQLMSDNQTNAMQRAQSEFDNYIKRIQLGMALEGHQAGLADRNAPKFPDITRSPADIPGRGMGIGLNPESASNVYNIFMQGMLDPRIQGNLDPTTGQTMSDAAKVAILLEQGRARGLSQEELNALQIIAAEYYGG